MEAHSQKGGPVIEKDGHCLIVEQAWGTKSSPSAEELCTFN